MKKMFFPLVALLFFVACGTTMPVSDGPDDSYLIHVECVPGATTKSEVLMLLKRARARDIKVEEQTSDMTIEAAYYKTDNDIAVLEGIADDIQKIGTVVHVEVRDNPRLVRENR